MFMLFPDIKPYAEHQLAVDDTHTLYIEEAGNPHGMPVLVLHGGPGAGCDPVQRRFFNPEQYRIILFDQRGAGRSQPYGELKDNNTQALINDIEKIRAKFDIETWVVYGGSWGATLALVYAQAYPKAVSFLVLRGVFLSRDEDIDWFYRDGANRIFPDAYQAFIKNIPAAERGDILAAYHKRLNGADELARMAACKQWALWEAQCATLKPSHTVVDHMTSPHVASSLAQIENHYFLNRCFLRQNQILEDIDRIADIPGIIIHGRYDMVCPVDNAVMLQQAWPQAQLQIVRDAGHASTETGIIDALVRAFDSVSKRFTDWR